MIAALAMGDNGDNAASVTYPDVFAILFLLLLWMCLWESWYYPWSRKREMKRYKEERERRATKGE